MIRHLLSSLGDLILAAQDVLGNAIVQFALGQILDAWGR